jgi:hypothetical protein
LVSRTFHIASATFKPASLIAVLNCAYYQATSVREHIAGNFHCYRLPDFINRLPDFVAHG